MRFQYSYVLLVPHTIQATAAGIRTVCARTPTCATRRKRSTGKPNLLVAATCIAVGLCSSAPRDAILEVVGAAALRGDRSDHGESAEENECDVHHDRREKFLWSGFDENCEQRGARSLPTDARNLVLSHAVIKSSLGLLLSVSEVLARVSEHSGAVEKCHRKILLRNISSVRS